MLSKSVAENFIKIYNQKIEEVFKVTPKDKEKLIDKATAIEQINGLDVFCPICKNILLDPIECKQCDHLFCHKCLFKWIEVEKK